MQGVDVNGVNIGGALVLLALAVIATNVCLEHSPMPPVFSAQAAGFGPRLPSGTGSAHTQNSAFRFRIASLWKARISAAFSALIPSGNDP